MEGPNLPVCIRFWRLRPTWWFSILIVLGKHYPYTYSQTNIWWCLFFPYGFPFRSEFQTIYRINASFPTYSLIAPRLYTVLRRSILAFPRPWGYGLLMFKEYSLQDRAELVQTRFADSWPIGWQWHLIFCPGSTNGHLDRGLGVPS